MKSKSAEENKNSLPSPMTATSIHEISSQEEKDSPTSTSGLLRKGFHSTPDLNKNGLNFPPNNSTTPMDLASELKTFQFKAKTDLDIICMNRPLNEVNDQRGYFTLPGRGKNLKLAPKSLPPPDHAPPPPPVASEVMLVKSPEKPTVTSPVMSSFKPENDYTEPNRYAFMIYYIYVFHCGGPENLKKIQAYKTH